MSVSSTMAAGQAARPANKPPAPAGSIGQQLLTKAQSSRSVIQDFVPLAESLEWTLGQQYLRERGNKAFLSDFSPVPYVINNDGTLSRNAAELFFTSLVEAEKPGELEPDIYVLELGIGVGLFARFFLDSFKELCQEHKKDFYDRLCYIAADKSERMLMDVCRHGVLANHGGHYRLRQVDALEPEKWLAGDAAFLEHPNKERPFRAVFLNYLLDCLPAVVLEFNDERGMMNDERQAVDRPAVKQLCVRTCVARNVNLADFTDMTLEQLQDRAKVDDAAARKELLEVYGLFASEYDYRPVDYQKLPYGEFGYEYARRWTKRLLLSYGALQSLDRLLNLVNERGFILINDYGQTQMSREDEFEHQRFSLATFVGLNFPLLKAYFEDRGEERGAQSAERRALERSALRALPSRHPPLVWLEPDGEGEGIHSRLLGREVGAETKERFRNLFGKAAREKLHEPQAKARECAKVGRFELAASYYNQALELQPRNWVLLNEISMFLTFSMRDPKTGIDMAKVALAQNPNCSAELWSTLGDGLFEFGRYPEARQAYLRALSINASDVRARYNLAWVYQREKNLPAALDMVSQALSLDKTGEYRERLVQKQTEILNQLAVRNQQEYLLLINLVSKYAKKEEQPKTQIAN